LFYYEIYTKHTLKCDGNGENMNEDGTKDKVNVSILLDDIENKVFISLFVMSVSMQGFISLFSIHETVYETSSPRALPIHETIISIA